MYDGPIIDGHCHLWDLGMDRHPWLRPTGGALQAHGDLPVGRLWTSFDAIFNGFKAIIGDFSEDEQSALFHVNARRVYRMDERTNAES
jgi:predicted TIM-barrel fold metal-dependent hydrolase